MTVPPFPFLQNNFPPPRTCVVFVFKPHIHIYIYICIYMRTYGIEHVKVKLSYCLNIKRHAIQQSSQRTSGGEVMWVNVDGDRHSLHFRQRFFSATTHPSQSLFSLPLSMRPDSYALYEPTNRWSFAGWAATAVTLRRFDNAGIGFAKTCNSKSYLGRLRGTATRQTVMNWRRTDTNTHYNHQRAWLCVPIDDESSSKNAALTSRQSVPNTTLTLPRSYSILLQHRDTLANCLFVSLLILVPVLCIISAYTAFTYFTPPYYHLFDACVSYMHASSFPCSRSSYWIFSHRTACQNERIGNRVNRKLAVTCPMSGVPFFWKGEKGK